jgi:hypothetical protein
LVTTTGQGQQQTVICLHLGQRPVVRGLLAKQEHMSNPGC